METVDLEYLTAKYEVARAEIARLASALRLAEQARDTAQQERDGFGVRIEMLLARNRDQQQITNRCPECGHQTLFIGAGGWLTCSWIECSGPKINELKQIGQRDLFLKVRQMIEQILGGTNYEQARKEILLEKLAALALSDHAAPEQDT